MESQIYRINMDGPWDLKDLYEFPHTYMQVYSYAYCFDTDLPAIDADRINFALENYPWAGGYSIVNIYGILERQVHVRGRPKIVEIKYASPGWIDLLLNLHPAVRVAGAVAAIAGSVAATTKAYHAVQKTLYDIRAESGKRRLEELQVTRAQIQELTGLTQDLSNLIGFERVHQLNQRTGHIVTTAKLVSAQYRRLKVLADYVMKKKATLPQKPRDEG